MRVGLNYHFDYDAVGGGRAKARVQQRRYQLARPGDLDLARSSRISSPFEGRKAFPRRGAGSRRRHARRRLPLMQGRWNGIYSYIRLEALASETRQRPQRPNGEFYKLGLAYPGRAVPVLFCAADVRSRRRYAKSGAGHQRFRRLHDWAQPAPRSMFGKFSGLPISSTLKEYGNSPRPISSTGRRLNAGTFDYAGDAWGFTYGAAAEWYNSGRWTLRAGVFDLSSGPGWRNKP